MNRKEEMIVTSFHPDKHWDINYYPSRNEHKTNMVGHYRRCFNGDPDRYLGFHNSKQRFKYKTNSKKIKKSPYPICFDGDPGLQREPQMIWKHAVYTIYKRRECYTSICVGDRQQGDTQDSYWERTETEKWNCKRRIKKIPIHKITDTKKERRKDMP
jgi:hypothetical protein